MASVNDWAAKAAERIDSEFMTAKHRPSVERIAAIIATFAAPILNLLQESRREHRDDIAVGLTCAAARNEDAACTCGAADWNARIDRALDGRRAPRRAARRRPRR